MLKIRLMGTKNDIKWFGKILQRNPKVEVTEFSDLYPNKGTKKFHAPNTINHYYQQEVQHDMYGGGWHEKGIV